MLIISQAFKAFWLCMYSAYKLRQAQSGFIPGHLAPPPSSKFCYADGFFVAYGTEAAGRPDILNSTLLSDLLKSSE